MTEVDETVATEPVQVDRVGLTEEPDKDTVTGTDGHEAGDEDEDSDDEEASGDDVEASEE